MDETRTIIVEVELLTFAGIDPFGQTARPGKIWLVNNKEDIDTFNLVDTSPNLLQNMGYLGAEFDKLTGVMPMTRGPARQSASNAATGSVMSLM